MDFIKSSLSAVCLFATLSVSSQAGVVYSETGGISSPTNMLDFSDPVLAEGETVTTQFAGVTFSGTNGSPRFQVCGPSSIVPDWGDINLDDSTWIGSAGLPCGNNVGIHDMTIAFDEAVNAASFQFLAYLPGAAEMVIDVLLAGTSVASFTITGTTDGATNPADCSHLDSATFTCGFLKITDLAFDTIFVAQPLPDTSYLTLDNLWWKVGGPLDSDNDGIADGVDNCPLIPNADQNDSDNDGFGDACDTNLNGAIVVSADTNILSGLSPSLTTFSVSDLALRPSGIEQFLVNVLQEGTAVFVDPSTDGNRGVQGANEQSNNYYNTLTGVTSVMPGGDFTDLAGIDLLVSIMPETPYTAAELSAMEALLNAGGTIFFLGDSNNFSLENGHINDALSFLGSDLRLDPVVTVIPWPRYTTSVATNSLMVGVPNFSVAVAGSVSGGIPLAFFNDGATNHVMVAVGSGGLEPVDSDGDTVPDIEDNCPVDANTDQADLDEDGAGDACDDDADGDGELPPLDCNDLDPGIFTTAIEICSDGIDNDCDLLVDSADDGGDCDGDTIPNGFDNCPDDANPGQADIDDDGLGDVCDPDDDNDGYEDGMDNCPAVANDQADFDSDGVGDACDSDSDGDSVDDVNDLCLSTAPSDSDAGVPSKRLGKNRWADIDGDGLFDTSGDNPTGRYFTIDDTAGCNCAQIIEACGYGQGHTKHGCSISVMDWWTGNFDREGEPSYQCKN